MYNHLEMLNHLLHISKYCYINMLIDFIRTNRKKERIAGILSVRKQTALREHWNTEKTYISETSSRILSGIFLNIFHNI